jgi:hypothetical protein
VPTEIQRGELADRLRRFMGLTGRVPLQLDETIVGVSVLQNLERPPYRLGIRGLLGFSESAGAAGNPTQIALAYPIGPAGTRGAAVVDAVQLENTSAGAQTTQLRLAFNLTGTWTAIQQAWDLDRPHNDQGTEQRLLPVVRQNNAVAQIGGQLMQTTTGGLGSRYLLELPQPIVLAPGAELLAVAPATVGLRALFLGTFHPDAILFP